MLFANNCNTTLNGGITAVATSMVVTSATGFPAPTGSQYFYCTLADAATQTTLEIVKVTSVSGTTFTIVRGQDGTTGTIFSSGAVVSLRLVRANLNDFPNLDEDNTFAGTITFSTPLLATNMVQSTTSTSGYLSSTDWNTFNNKSNTNGTVTSVAALTLGTSGTDLSSTVATGTTTPVITLNVPTASATNRGALSAADWTTFNSKAPAFTYTTGYIPFGQGTTTPNQSANLFWDSTNNRLGVGTATPYTQLSLYTTIYLPTSGEATGVGSLRITNNQNTLSADGGIEFKGSGDSGGNGSKIQNLNGLGLALAIRTNSATWTQALLMNTVGGVQALNTISVGNATPATSGAGITFPATQSASTDANTLDDYEEGTWTPNQGTGLTVVGAFSSFGKYTKIGNVVTVSGVMQAVTSIALSANGQISTNLPFTANATTFGTGGLFNNVSAATIIYANANSTNLYNTATTIGATTLLYFSCTYQST